MKEKSVSGLTQKSQVPARIVFEYDGDLNLPFVILLDRLHDGDFTGEREVHHVCARFRVQAHAISELDFDAADIDRLERRLVFEKLPFPLVHLLSPRMVPWSF